MNTETINTSNNAGNNTVNKPINPALGDKITQISEVFLRFSVVVVLVWIGAMKFTAYEAGAIQGLVASSPLTSWLYSIFSVQSASNLIGSVELLTAIALVVGPFNRKIAVLGALSAAVTFLVTLSFLLTAPVWEASLGGFPALNVLPGQFLLKDIVLLAAATTLLGKALK